MDLHLNDHQIYLTVLSIIEAVIQYETLNDIMEDEYNIYGIFNRVLN